MIVHCGNDGAQDGHKNSVVLRIFARIEQIPLPVEDGPVIVFAGTVYSCKGLFVQQTDQPVPFGHLPENFHYQHVMVAGKVDFFEDGGQFKLGRCHFVMPGLGGNAEFPQFLLHFRHKIQHPHFDGAEIVVFQLLMFGGRRPEDAPAGLQKVRPLQIEMAVNQEVFLLDPQRYGNFFIRQAKALHQPFGGHGKSLNGTQKRGFLIQCFAGMGTEDRGNAQRCPIGMTLDKGRTGGVPRCVAAGFKSGTQSAGGETGGIRFTHDQVFAGKGHQSLFLAEFQKRVMLFGGGPGQRKEPVSVGGGAPLNGPLFHGVGHITGNG